MFVAPEAKKFQERVPILFKGHQKSIRLDNHNIWITGVRVSVVRINVFLSDMADI